MGVLFRNAESTPTSSMKSNMPFTGLARKCFDRRGPRVLTAPVLSSAELSTNMKATVSVA